MVLDVRSNDIENLSRKLNILISKQDVLSREIDEIKSALDKYRKLGAVDEVIAGSTENQKQRSTESHISVKGKSADKAYVTEKQIPQKDEETLNAGKVRKSVFTIPESVRSNLEDFIGTNLFNKIGILILIIGISIGTKFAIDRDLISPMVRLILGYVLGGALLFFAYRLKQKYHNFSAVLISGSMAIIYFMTFAGIIYLEILSLNTAFSIMVIVTVFTVYQALRYDRQVIAIIGLEGAYAIPFLIGGDPEGYIFLFYYMAIINAGILII